MTKHDEFDRQYEAAMTAGRRAEQTEPRARAARYDARNKRIVVQLKNGVVLAFPPRLGQGLERASPRQLAEVEITPGGYGLHWEELDADLSVPGLATGIFGTKAWMSELARHAGSRTSPRKAAAARANGRKGGRPVKHRAASSR